MGGKWVWWIWSLVYFHSFEALNDAFEVQYFSGLHLYTLPKTLIACSSDFFLCVKTLLNNAFNNMYITDKNSNYFCTYNSTKIQFPDVIFWHGISFYTPLYSCNVIFWVCKWDPLPLRVIVLFTQISPRGLILITQQFGKLSSLRLAL